MAADGR